MVLVLAPNRKTVGAQGAGLATDRPRNLLSDRAGGRRWSRCRPSGYRGKGGASSSVYLMPGCIDFGFDGVRQQAAPVVLAVIQRAIVEALRLCSIIRRVFNWAGFRGRPFMFFGLRNP